MHWERLDRSSPSDGTTCVVGHFIQGQRKPIVGIWKFCYRGSDSYWETKSGEKITCGKYDNWCDIEVIINNVYERIEDEIRDEINRTRLMNGILN